MRKGARWYSMEMAGVVTYTGANIIKGALELVDRIGIPLELDTDGIWCMLPGSFPEEYDLETRSGKKHTLSYPGAMLNVDVFENFTNNQYETLTDEQKRQYRMEPPVNTILFEVDGPYKAMILPASKEEGKKLKKRYAVFNDDGSLAELKGFEIKRRGELKLIKDFQGEVFSTFLRGGTLQECYTAVGAVSQHYYDILQTEGVDLTDSELERTLMEARSMSKPLHEYGAQKSTSITTARRLAEFLGPAMVKDAGLACKYIICREPEGAPVTERAIPIAIFSAEDKVRKHFLRKWTRNGRLAVFEMRPLLDWEYYKGRLGSAIQKIVTIPAALQGVDNPVPDVEHPDWLKANLRAQLDPFKQKGLASFGFTGGATKSVGVRPRGRKAPSGRDGGGKKAAAPAAAPARVNRLTRAEAEYASLAAAQPTRNADFTGWLTVQKQLWTLRRRIKELLNSEQVAATVAAATATAGSVSAELLARSAASRGGRAALASDQWQVLHIAETDVVGELCVWVAVRGEMHSVRLVVPRVVYINSRRELSSSNLRPVVRHLPRSEHAHHLYELAMDEQSFQAAEKILNAELFSSEDCLGVYEQQVTPGDRALHSIGALTAVTRECRLRLMEGGGDRVFRLEDLVPLTAKEAPNPRARGTPYADEVRRVYLYVAHAQQGNVASRRDGVVLLVLPPVAGQERAQCHLVLASAAFATRRGRLSEEVTMRKLKRNYAELGKQIRERDGEDPPPLEFSADGIHRVDSLQQAHKKAAALLRTYLAAAPRAPAVCLVESSMTPSALRTEVRPTGGLPVARVPFNMSDTAFQIMAWQLPQALLALQRFANSQSWWAGQLAQARYVNTPVCNLPADVPSFATDMFLARRLLADSALLWSSRGSRPDLGGVQHDENVGLAETRAAPLVCKPGFHRTVCVELTVENVTMNAIFNAPHALSASDAEDLLHPGETAAAIKSEKARMARLFGAVRDMVKEWVVQASAGDDLADRMLAGIYRWMSNPAAALYDPMLHRVVRDISAKVFMQFLAELKRAGLSIVYASLDRVFVKTTKSSLLLARAQIDYVVKKVRKDKLFNILQVRPETYWRSLLFLDVSNFGGIELAGADGVPLAVAGGSASPPPPALAPPAAPMSPMRSPFKSPQTRREVHVHAGGSTPATPMRGSQVGGGADRNVALFFAIADGLPASVQSYFEVAVAEFIALSAEHYDAAKELSATGQTPQKRRRKDDADDGTLDEASAALRASAQAIVARLASYLLTIVTTIRRAHTTDASGVDVALEFIKGISHVLALDAVSEEFVTRLRRTLLKAIKVGEYDEKSRFVNNTLSYVLPDVICGFCSGCRDVDLARDPAFVDGGACGECRAPFDMRLIENRLMEKVEAASLEFLVQDLRCEKCHSQRIGNLSSYCECAGRWVLSISKANLVARLKPLQGLAAMYNMRRLAGVLRDAGVSA